MKKKVLRWLVYSVGAILLLIVAGILLIDTIARSIAENHLRTETGMEASIGKFTVGLTTPTVRIENLVLKNPAKFGGNTFLEMPELHIGYDRDALRSGHLHLKLVRINIDKVHIVEGKDGKKNIDALQKHQGKSKSLRNLRSSTNKTEPAFIFDGIDTLDVTLNSVQFTNEKDPAQNQMQNLGIKNEVLRNLKTDIDFQTAGIFLLLKAGLAGSLDFNALLKKSPAAGAKSNSVLDEVTEPLSLNSTNP